MRQPTDILIAIAMVLAETKVNHFKRTVGQN